jgi:hypothetical protein
MTPIKIIGDALQALPAPARKTLYTILALVGVGLAVCDALGVNDLGPVALDQALQAYAYLSPAIGAIAVANVGRPVQAEEVELADFDEDVDLSSFEPVGLVSDVYGEATI